MLTTTKALIHNSTLQPPVNVLYKEPLLRSYMDVARPRSDNCRPVNISTVTRVVPKPPSLTGMKPHYGNAHNQPDGLLSDVKYPQGKPKIPLPNPYFPAFNSEIKQPA